MHTRMTPGYKPSSRVSVKRQVMNWVQIEGNWMQAEWKEKQRWANLTDDELTALEGKRGRFAGTLRERCGTPRSGPSRS